MKEKIPLFAPAILKENYTFLRIIAIRNWKAKIKKKYKNVFFLRNSCNFCFKLLRIFIYKLTMLFLCLISLLFHKKILIFRHIFKNNQLLTMLTCFANCILKKLFRKWHEKLFNSANRAGIVGSCLFVTFAPLKTHILNLYSNLKSTYFKFSELETQFLHAAPQIITKSTCTNLLCEARR